MTTRIETLRYLQKRIRESKGADRKIDRAIGEAFGQKMGWSGDIDGLGYAAYTASLDACEALLNAVLPGAEWDKRHNDFEIYGGSCFVRALPLATDHLTFLDAIVSAEISEMEAKESAT